MAYTEYNYTKDIPVRFREKFDAIIGKDWKLVYEEDKDSGKYGGHMYALIDKDKKPVSHFFLCQLPGCCGICVSFYAYVMPPFRKKGLGVLFNDLQGHIATQRGYGLLISTDVKSNIPQRKILAKNGWKDIYGFVNPRTNNEVAISIKELGGK
jgi:GNAT superfamily N-acetyltransferase